MQNSFLPGIDLKNHCQWILQNFNRFQSDSFRCNLWHQSEIRLNQDYCEWFGKGFWNFAKFQSVWIRFITLQSAPIRHHVALKLFQIVLKEILEFFKISIGFNPIYSAVIRDINPNQSEPIRHQIDFEWFGKRFWNFANFQSVLMRFIPLQSMTSMRTNLTTDWSGMLQNGWETDIGMGRNISDSLGLNSNPKLSPGKFCKITFYQE